MRSTCTINNDIRLRLSLNLKIFRIRNSNFYSPCFGATRYRYRICVRSRCKLEHGTEYVMAPCPILLLPRLSLPPSSQQPCSLPSFRESHSKVYIIYLYDQYRTSAPVDPNAANFHPVSSKFQPSELFGELEAKDLEWTCPGGFATETLIFYNVLEDGTTTILQVIHSSIGCASPFTSHLHHSTYAMWGVIQSMVPHNPIHMQSLQS